MKTILVATVFAMAVVQLGLAQMRGPGGVGGGTVPGTGMVGRTGFQMEYMLPPPAVGPDGTAYAMRVSTSTMAGSNTQTKTELIAVSAQNGKTNWALEIDGTMFSEPVLSKDGGTIFLTTSEPGPQAARQPGFIVVVATATAARVSNRVDIDADLLSSPSVTPDGQTIYIVAAKMPVPARGNVLGNSTLYAFSPAGALKFKVALN